MFLGVDLGNYGAMSYGNKQKELNVIKNLITKLPAKPSVDWAENYFSFESAILIIEKPCERFRVGKKVINGSKVLKIEFQNWAKHFDKFKKVYMPMPDTWRKAVLPFGARLPQALKFMGMRPASCDYAERLFPHLPWSKWKSQFRGNRCPKGDSWLSGIVDSLLLCYYGILMEEKNGKLLCL